MTKGAVTGAVPLNFLTPVPRSPVPRPAVPGAIQRERGDPGLALWTVAA